MDFCYPFWNKLSKKSVKQKIICPWIIIKFGSSETKYPNAIFTVIFATQISVNAIKKSHLPERNSLIQAANSCPDHWPNCGLVHDTAVGLRTFLLINSASSVLAGLHKVSGNVIATLASCCLHNITTPSLSHCLLNVLDVISLLIRMYLIALGKGSLLFSGPFTVLPGRWWSKQTYGAPNVFPQYKVSKLT